MQSIGLSLATIVMIGLIAQAGKLVFEIPSSVLADRWHRRNTLIVATILMMVASALLPLATNALEYGLFVVLWTVYYAFKSGTDTAFIFDSLKSLGAENQFQRILARYHSWEYAGLVVSGVIAGWIVSVTNLQVPYWLTILPLTIGVIALWRLPEVRIVEQGERGKWWNHTLHAWHDIQKNALVWIVVLCAMLLALQLIWYEYYQIYGLVVHTPQLWFGILLAILCSGLIVGAEITRRVRTTKQMVGLFWLVIAATHIVGLLVAQFAFYLVVLFVAMVAMQVLYLNFITAINQGVGSTRRATVISLAGSASQLLFLGLAILFRVVTDSRGVQAAFLTASVPLLVLGSIDIICRIPWLTRKQSPDTLAQSEVSSEVR